MSEDEEEVFVQGWRVVRVQIGRGFGKPAGDDQAPIENVIGLHLWCEDLDRPGDFLFGIEEAETTALALLDTVRRAREN